MSHTSWRVNLQSKVSLNVKLLARSRRHIWSLGDSNGIRIHSVRLQISRCWFESRCCHYVLSVAFKMNNPLRHFPLLKQKPTHIRRKICWKRQPFIFCLSDNLPYSNICNFDTRLRNYKPFIGCVNNNQKQLRSYLHKTLHWIPPVIFSCEYC